MNRRTSTVCMVMILLAASLPAQEREWDQELQRGFSTLELGMQIDAAKSALLEDQHFLYRGDPDVSFLPVTRLPVIEVAGVAFVERGIFQFHNDRLFVVSLLLNRRRLDYYSVYTSLVERYGEPASLDPGAATWEDGRTRVSIERPLTLKYIDLDAFNEIVADGRAAEALDAMSRELFLDGL